MVMHLVLRSWGAVSVNQALVVSRKSDQSGPGLPSDSARVVEMNLYRWNRYLRLSGIRGAENHT